MSSDMTDVEVLHPYDEEELVLDAATIATLWELFVAIGEFWNNVTDSAPMKSRWLTFLDNRVRTDPSYVAEYRQAAKLILSLVETHGRAGAFELIFTDQQANLSPPRTRLARLRQRVSNEFVDLQLALGGFRSFGAENYLGYIGGANIPGERTPYRTSED